MFALETYSSRYFDKGIFSSHFGHIFDPSIKRMKWKMRKVVEKTFYVMKHSM